MELGEGRDGGGDVADVQGGGRGDVETAVMSKLDDILADLPGGGGAGVVMDDPGEGSAAGSSGPTTPRRPISAPSMAES